MADFSGCPRFFTGNYRRVGNIALRRYPLGGVETRKSKLTAIIISHSHLIHQSIIATKYLFQGEGFTLVNTPPPMGVNILYIAMYKSSEG